MSTNETNEPRHREGTNVKAEQRLEGASDLAGCCSAEEQTECCAPSEKASCCGGPRAQSSSGCGCR